MRDRCPTRDIWKGSTFTNGNRVGYFLLYRGKHIITHVGYSSWFSSKSMRRPGDLLKLSFPRRSIPATIHPCHSIASSCRTLEFWEGSVCPTQDGWIPPIASSKGFGQAAHSGDGCRLRHWLRTGRAADILRSSLWTSSPRCSWDGPDGVFRYSSRLAGTILVLVIGSRLSIRGWITSYDDCKSPKATRRKRQKGKRTPRFSKSLELLTSTSDPPQFQT